MAAKEYEVEIHVTHTVFVVADSDEEAEELALEAFMDEPDHWDDIDIEIVGVEEI